MSAYDYYNGTLVLNRKSEGDANPAVWQPYSSEINSIIAEIRALEQSEDSIVSALQMLGEQAREVLQRIESDSDFGDAEAVALLDDVDISVMRGSSKAEIIRNISRALLDYRHAVAKGNSARRTRLW